MPPTPEQRRPPAPKQPAAPGSPAPTLDVTVNAAHLNYARNGLSTEVGSSVYRIMQDDIDAKPPAAQRPSRASPCMRMVVRISN